MSIWKSPIFYFGILLLLAVTGAVIAPFVVDWNRYKSDLEAYGERLTGRNVQINGPVTVSLFPFPRLQAEFVDLGNTDDPGKGTFATAEKVAVRVALDGLFAGQLRVEEITIEKPVVELQRYRDGSVNWIVETQETLKNSPLLEQVRLDRITLTDATIRLLDEQRLFQTSFEDVDATLSAQQIVGPWRSEGKVTVYGQRASFIVTTSTYAEIEPLRVGMKLLPDDKALPIVAFDGAIDKREAKGKIRLDPAETDEAKGNPEGRFRPLVLQADVSANDESIALTAIRITPADTNDGSTLIEGEIKAQFSDRVTAEANFVAARLNLDAVLGAQAFSAWQAGGMLALINQVITRVPERLDLKANLKANVLTTAQETLENVEVAAEIASGNMRLRRASANLPGRSRILADGIAFSSGAGAEFGGKLALEANDLRLLSGWLWPTARPWIATHWTGSRGQLKLQGNIDWSGERLALKDLDYELDGEGGIVDLTLTQGDLPTLEAKAKINKLDVDAFIPKGFALRKADSQLSWADAVAAVTGLGQGKTVRLDLSTKTLTLNRTTAHDVSLSTETQDGGIAIDSFSIGSVGSAEVTAKGRITSVDGAYEGEITAGLTAADPNNFLRLIGVASQDELAPWQRQLGQTDATAKLVMQRGTNEPEVTVALDAKSGRFDLSATANLSELATPGGIRAKGAAEIITPDGAQLLRLFGVETQPVSVTPGKLAMNFDGQPKTGFMLDARLEALATTIGFEGAFQASNAPVPALDGKLSVISADPQMIFQGLGYPAAAPAGKLMLNMALKPQLEALRIDNISGNVGSSSFSGNASITANRAVMLDLNGGVMKIDHITGPAFMQWLGTEPTLDSSFGANPPFVTRGEIWLRPDRFSLSDGLEVKEAVIGVQVSAGSRQISVAGRSEEGDPITLELALQPAGSQYTVSSSGKFPLDLATLLKSKESSSLIDGKATLTFKASGIGLTPIAAATDATGKGTLEIADASLANFAPDTFAARIGQVKSGDDLRTAISSLRNNERFALPPQTIPLTIAAGRITADEVAFDSAATNVTINAEADLLEHALAATLQLKLKNPAGLPAVNLKLAGPPNALRQRLETSELAGKLGYEIMAREMAELERVQAEQQRAIEEEEAQRVRDEERYQAYLEQRAELRLRQRELKVHEVQRALKAEAAAAYMASQATEWSTANKQDVSRRIREQRIFRAMANGGVSKPVRSKRVALPIIQELPEGFVLPQ